MPLLSSEDADLELGKAVMQSLKAQKVKTHKKMWKNKLYFALHYLKLSKTFWDSFGSLYSLKCIQNKNSKSAASSQSFAM